jgi:hypothetical protein
LIDIRNSHGVQRHEESFADFVLVPEIDGNAFG